jgi:hypothetical protein
MVVTEEWKDKIRTIVCKRKPRQSRIPQKKSNVPHVLRA